MTSLLRHAHLLTWAPLAFVLLTGCDLFRTIDTAVQSPDPVVDMPAEPDMDVVRDLGPPPVPTDMPRDMVAVVDMDMARDMEPDAVVDYGRWTFENTLAPKRATRGLRMLYSFNEGAGLEVKDTSGVSPAVDLSIDGVHSWVADGLQVEDARVTATTLPVKFYDAISERESFTLEVWATTSALDQTGPARVVSFSANAGERNLTLGVAGDAMVVRMGSSGATAANSLGNGIPDVTLGGVIDLTVKHLVVTYDGLVVRLYVDGVLRGQAKRVGGLAGWDRSYSLVMGNEFDNPRPWRGTLHLVAAYDRVLSAREVRGNFEIGARP